MSSGSTSSPAPSKRIEAIQSNGRLARKDSHSRATIVSTGDAYSYALRSAYLHHLIQPKAKRLQHVAAPATRPALTRHSTSVADLVKELSHVRDNKAMQFPHSFMTKLEKRLLGVMTGEEKMADFAESGIKRICAIFLNEFRKPDFRRLVEKDRRLEALILKFFSIATKELQATKTPNDDSYKLLVDRYVALFVRLINATLKANDWAKDKPELVARLNTLENKLLLHDNDLSADSQRNGGAGGKSVEVEVPRSSEVKDMPLVQVVASIFDRSFAQVQSDLDAMKASWTEKAGLQDLKSYQTNLDLNSKQTLQTDDFDTESAYETWKNLEISELAFMTLSILQTNPHLASTGVDISPLRHVPTSSSDMSYSDTSKRLSEVMNDSSYVIDQPVDMSGMHLYDGDYETDVHNSNGDTVPAYTYIPPDPRTYYRMVLEHALSHDLSGEETAAQNGAAEPPILSKRSLNLLLELRLRWRVPYISALMLFLDVVREKFLEREAGIAMVDAAFYFFKDPPLDNESIDLALVFDRHNWTMKDYLLNRKILTTLHDAVLRDLFAELLNCFESTPPDIIHMMAVLEDHIYKDSMYEKTPGAEEKFTAQLATALNEKALEIYANLKNTNIGAPDQVEFFHIIQLGNAVMKLCKTIQKRYRKSPDIMGVEPFIILVKAALPLYVKDARDLISSILNRAQLNGEEIPVQDGFELYNEMVGIRSIFVQALPRQDFEFNIETLLETFVWRWISKVDSEMLGWVEGAVKQDPFQVRHQQPNQAPSDEDRHSVSVVDIFTSFEESLKEILRLKWDNAYQSAKFMTALARAFGGGIARYCDLVEGLFVKEMDRLTPERKAAISRTRPEKWMQIARDTISGREKMEPFQFFPESFVKLNNIGYAMLQFDQLEKKMNVDECAAVILRNEPLPAQRQRKTENLVFTIKIIEAKDLAAGDVNGLSDPYVVLGDQNQRRLAKTRVIYNNLNPRWEETIDITTQGPLNIVATVWDWDMMGEHDCLGRTTLKLDPTHFRDFLPREYWLDLDRQGRLLVRVSMEGEKDDIQFYFGKAFRVLKRTERDMIRKITDKLSAYIEYCLSRRMLKSMTTERIGISTVSKFFSLGERAPAPSTAITPADIAASLDPLFTYFNENFSIMQQTLTTEAMANVMTRLWKEILSTIESLLVPPLSDKPSPQRQLSEKERDIVFEWLRLLFDFFHHADEDDPSIVHGLVLDTLKSPKYQDLRNLHFFYYEPTENLIRESERMASATAERQRAIQTRLNRLSAPASLIHQNSHHFGHGASAPSSYINYPSVTKRSKSIMLNRNLGTIRKAKEEKRREAQAEPSDDMVLRILRMRPEAAQYLKERSRQKERLASAAAAEMIVRQSLMGRS